MPLHLLPQDLPVCLPGRPCVDLPPLAADVINLVTALTPASGGIAAACFVSLGIALVLSLVGLRPGRRGGPSPWLVLLAVVLLLPGAAIAGSVEARRATISSVYGFGGDPDFSLFGSWDLVSLAAHLMVLLGVLVLVATALISTTRLQHQDRSASATGASGMRPHQE